MRNYNSNIDTCQSDLSTFGDLTGMKQCFRDLGLDVPDDDGYFSNECNEAVDVIEIF